MTKGQTGPDRRARATNGNAFVPSKSVMNARRLIEPHLNSLTLPQNNNTDYPHRRYLPLLPQSGHYKPAARR